MIQRLTLAVSVFTVFFFAFSAFSTVGDAFMMSQTLKNVEVMKMTRKIKNDLNFAARQISKKGEKAFPELMKLNEKDKTEIYVIDPIDGKILVAPETVYQKGNTFEESSINTKILANEVRTYRLLVQSDEKGFFSFFTSRDIDLYPGGFAARTVIAPSWKVYVVFTHREGIAMEKHFVTGTVLSAANIIKEEGLDGAIKVFEKKGSPFKSQDSYIWIYKINGELVYNPEYPELVGKNPLTDGLDSEFAKCLTDIIKVAKEDGSGWSEYKVRRPGKDKDKAYPKAIYFQLVKSAGKEYVVGTGLYLEKNK